MIWVEILGRHGDVVARHRCEGAETTIGRGYDNDVIVDDPTVAPRHLRIVRDPEGRLVAFDEGTSNGLYDGDRGPLARVAVDGDRPLRIGRTQLRIREASHAVAPERKALPATHVWPRALAVAAAVIALETFLAWLGDTTERKLARYVLPLGGLIVITLAWTSAWAILTRIFSGQARFERHLLIACSGLLAFSLWDELVDAVAFAFSWRALADYEYIGMWALLAIVCYFHLREVAPVHLRLKAGLVFGLGAAAAAAQTLAQSELKPWNARDASLRDQKPPFMRVVAPKDGAAFFADVEQLKPKLDRARKEETPAGSLADDED